MLSEKKKILNEKKPIAPPLPLQVKWSVPNRIIGLFIPKDVLFDIPVVWL
jgi:hypothetical protein